jgi:SAM-dependent methyltransferase
VLNKSDIMKDVLGEAIWDYFFKRRAGKLWIHNKYGQKEEMPVATYFRDAQTMPKLEQIALQRCAGKILDVGAGAGSHALELQAKGIDVTALEFSEKASEVMRLRGVKKVVHGDIFTYDNGGYDTILLLMNGIGLTGSIAGLSRFLQLAKNWLNNSGQIIFDSSDVAYLYEDDLPFPPYYYGEINYSYEYKKQRTDWFTWLYIDRKTLTEIAAKEGWQTEILFIDEFDQYLARLTQT